MIIVLKKESLETGRMVFTLAQLESLEICLKEAEEKAKALSEQVIPNIRIGNICPQCAVEQVHVLTSVPVGTHMCTCASTHTQHFIHFRYNNKCFNL